MNSLLPEEKTDRYQLLERIAVGGMAELYRARMMGEQGFEKLVAVKKILPHLANEEDLVNAFIEEAKLAALLQHPNIIQIFDFGRLQGTYFIAMEYLYGQDLNRLMRMADRKNRPVGLGTSLHLISRICDGLDYAHHLSDAHGMPLNIIHRDISPQNIFITREGQVKIIDFGIAKAASQNTMTQAGVIKGKAAYMSPEQAAGEKVDLRSDLFSVGILLFELITRKPLFEGDTFQVLAQLRKFRPAEVLTAEVPEALQPVLKRALAPNPDDRYPSAARFRRDLDTCSEQLGLRSGSRELSACIKSLLPAETNAASSPIIRTGAGSAVSTAGAEAVSVDAQTVAWGPEALEEAPADSVAANHQPPSADPAQSRLKTAVLPVAAVAVIGLVVFLFTFGADPAHENTPALEAAVATQPLKEAPVPEGLADKPPPVVEAAQAAGRPPETVSLYESALSAQPPLRAASARDASQALVERADPLMRTDLRQAEELLLKAIQLDPDNSRGHFKLGRLYLEKKDYPAAISHYSRVTELDPALTKAFYNLGYAYMQSQSWALAEKSFRRAVQQSPPYLDEVLFNLAFVQHKRGERQACIQSLKRALRVNPKNQRAGHFLEQLER